MAAHGVAWRGKATVVLNQRASSERRLPAHQVRRDPAEVASLNTAGLHLVVDLTEVDEPRLEIDLRPYLTDDAGLLTASQSELAVKRGVDILASILFLILFSPILLITALAVVATSRGPVIFRQQRVGQGGDLFEFFKFRSMYMTAEEDRYLLVDQNEADGPIFKIAADPRITPVGKFIRRTSIDELPQLWNVLRGDMSLVGPRPPLPEEVAQYTDWERQRLMVRPGVTGIWQVSGRSDLDFETWVAMDVEYIEEWRPSLDFALMVKTIPAVLSGRGAY
jgi:exopolysaccharide biosynthesis polyprenyl glycosylphosphotransferase